MWSKSSSTPAPTTGCAPDYHSFSSSPPLPTAGQSDSAVRLVVSKRPEAARLFWWRLGSADPLTQSTSCQAVKSDGQTALHEAAEAGQREAVEYLLSLGANTQAQDEVRRMHAASQLHSLYC